MELKDLKDDNLVEVSAVQATLSILGDCGLRMKAIIVGMGLEQFWGIMMENLSCGLLVGENVQM